MKPELYNKFIQRPYQEAEYLMRKFNDIYDESSKENCTLIDIGTGCGKVLNEVIIGKSNIKVKKVFAVDISQKTIDFAMNKYESEMIKFHCVDIVSGENAADKAMNTSGIAFGSVDIVSSFYCLHWVVNLRNAFINICNFLKPSGWFLCILVNKYVMFEAYVAASMDEQFSDIMFDLNEVFPVAKTSYSSQVIEEICGELKLETRFLQVKNDSYDFQTREIFKASMDALNPYVYRMSDYQQNNLMNFVADYAKNSNEIKNPGYPYR